ncbi:MAG TPA: class III extradiol ring-cleavage dioxygenase [Burkholderiales bacterium]|jgi:4,5-DOPA dioxygenase extradiol|nr:class III extradiol ring-cleavage dioxygenase [Burkholderiales bacterium]
MLPSVFISHGSPMHALQPGPAGEAWAALGRRLGKPRAILIASAHWETNLPMLTGSAKPETIHDFYNFPEPLYRLRYPAPGAPEVAQRAQALLKDGGFTAGIDGCRGLDHGAWAPLLYAYPGADVPVVQISVQPALGPRHHLGVGRSLRKLLDEGVLIIGSGHMTHNLRDWMRGQGAPQPYAKDFSDWVQQKIVEKDVDALVDYRSRNPNGARAHPTDEHFLPLFIALGAAPGQGKPERVYDAIDSGVLSMDAYVLN